MADSPDLFARYTTTSVLASPYPRAEAVAWAKGHFRAHYGKFLPASKDAAILDLGCGYGVNLSCLVDMGYVNCHGIDISAEQIEYARTTMGLSNVEHADARHWLEGKRAM